MKSILIGAACLSAFLLGLFLGKTSVNDQETTDRGERSFVRDSTASPSPLLSAMDHLDDESGIREFYRLLSTMSSEEISAILIDHQQPPGYGNRLQGLEMLAEYLSFVDPIESIKIRKSLEGFGIIEKSFRQLGRRNFDAALGAYKTLKHNEKNVAIQAALSGASEKDPAEAYLSFKAIPDLPLSEVQRITESVFVNGTIVNPVSTSKVAASIENSIDRKTAINIVATKWAKMDPKATLQWIDSLNLGRGEAQQLNRSAMFQLANHAPEEILELVAAPTSSLPPLMQEQPQLLGNLTNIAIVKLTQVDREAALNWIREAPDSSIKKEAIGTWARYAITATPEEVIRLARHTPEHARMAGSAFRQLARRDLPFALATASEWQGTPSYEGIVVMIAIVYGKLKPDEAIEWALTQDKAYRNKVVKEVISGISRSDSLGANNPKLASQHLDKLDLEGANGSEDYLNATRIIMGSWFQEDALAAMTWAESIPLDDVREGVVIETFTRWAREDPDRASTWVGTVENDRMRERLIISMVRAVKIVDSERARFAVKWAAEIGEPTTRESMLRIFHRRWATFDPDGANHSLESIQKSENEGHTPEMNDATTEASDQDFEGNIKGNKPGEERTILGVRVCWIPPGAFEMGSPKTEEHRGENENQVSVSLSHGYWMAKYECTRMQWNLIGISKSHGLTISSSRPGEDKGDLLPVGNVSWESAKRYCDALSSKLVGNLKKNGWRIDLPTEAQWEYACRAETTTPYSFGEALPHAMANTRGYLIGNQSLVESIMAPTKVGSYPGNPWSLHDMHGNLLEWCRDWYFEKLPGGEDPEIKTQPKTGLSGPSHAARGGTWGGYAFQARSAQRFGSFRKRGMQVNEKNGFRIVLVPPDK